jgi:transposase-like protein
MSPASRPCSPCASRGRPNVPATRVMHDGMGKCDACFHGKVEPLPRSAVDAALGRPTPAMEEKAMHKEIDWNAVQNDRTDGKLTVDEIAKKYGVHPSSIYNHTKSARQNGAPAKTARLSKTRTVKLSNGAGELDVAATVAQLKTKREKIDRSIAALEELL